LTEQRGSAGGGVTNIAGWPLFPSLKAVATAGSAQA
jgi:hypothetical protein